MDELLAKDTGLILAFQRLHRELMSTREIEVSNGQEL